MKLNDKLTDKEVAYFMDGLWKGGAKALCEILDKRIVAIRLQKATKRITKASKQGRAKE